MAVPGYEAYCFDVAYPAGYSFVATGYTLVNSPDGCVATGKEWVAVQATFFDSLVTAAAAGPSSPSTPPANPYQDSTDLFYLGMVAIVAVWAWKAIVQKLVFAS